MRTLVNLTDQQMKALDDYCREERVSRAEAVRRAVDRFLPARTREPRNLERHPAFGSWADRKIDALEYQMRMRGEWEA